MEFLSELWLPILLSAVFVWIASSILHMVLPHHKSEWKPTQNEDEVMKAFEGAEPGQYMYPYCADMSEMNSPEFQEKMKKGPVGIAIVWPGPVNMGRNLGLMLGFYLLVGLFVAYVGWYGMGMQEEYLHVFRVAGAAALMAHWLGAMPLMVWFGFKGFWTYTFDSVVYALITAGVFAWQWPS